MGLILVGEKIRREQAGSVPTFVCSHEQIRQVKNRLNKSGKTLTIRDRSLFMPGVGTEEIWVG